MAALQPLIDGGGTVTIFGPLPCRGTYAVTAASPVTIQGANNASLDANGAGSTLTVDFNKTVTLKTLTVKGGAAGSFGRGGGIHTNCCNATVNLVAATVSGNTAFIGGGVYLNGGTLNSTNSTVKSNTATDEGGGIAADDGSDVTLTGSTVASNTASQGGGLDLDFVALAATASTIFQNTATGSFCCQGGAGGGIKALHTDMSLTNTTVAWNTLLMRVAGSPTRAAPTTAIFRAARRSRAHCRFPSLVAG
jgi:parallel beta-helix repeat protein